MIFFLKKKMERLYSVLENGGNIIFIINIEINQTVSFKKHAFVKIVNEYITNHLQQFLSLMYFDTESLSIICLSAKNGIDMSFIKGDMGISTMHDVIYDALNSTSKQVQEDQFKLSIVRKKSMAGIFDLITHVIENKNNTITNLNTMLHRTPMPIDIILN